MKTIGSIILGTMEDLIDHKVIPEVKCPRCKVGYMFKDDVFCDECIDDIINDEGE